MSSDPRSPRPPGSASPSAAAAEAFRRAGLPFTVQRRAIWDALAGSTDHPTADEVWALLEPREAGISRTTVYRTLETLVRLGLAERVGHPGVAVRYDPRTSRHHHLVCEECGAVLDYEDRSLDALTLPAGAMDGFEVRDFSVQIVGRCADCAAGRQKQKG